MLSGPLFSPGLEHRTALGASDSQCCNLKRTAALGCLRFFRNVAYVAGEDCGVNPGDEGIPAPAARLSTERWEPQRSECVQRSWRFSRAEACYNSQALQPRLFVGSKPRRRDEHATPPGLPQEPNREPPAHHLGGNPDPGARPPSRPCTW